MAGNRRTNEATRWQCWSTTVTENSESTILSAELVAASNEKSQNCRPLAGAPQVRFALATVRRHPRRVHCSTAPCDRVSALERLPRCAQSVSLCPLNYLSSLSVLVSHTPPRPRPPRRQWRTTTTRWRLRTWTTTAMPACTYRVASGCRRFGSRSPLN